MDSTTNFEFWGHPVERLLMGKGTLARIGELVEDLGKKRVLLLSGRNLAARTDLVPRLQDLLETRWIGSYHDIPPHPSLTSIEAGSRCARRLECDVLVSLGGGSVMDTAKGITLSLSTSEPLVQFRAGSKHSGPSHALSVPFIAVPTTLSASEFTDGFGLITEEGKVVIHRRRLAASTVILDPEVLATTPSEILRSSISTCLAHTVEGLCSPVCTPTSRLLLSEGLGTIAEAISGLEEEKTASLEILGKLQVALHFCGLGMYNTHMGLSHALTQAVASRSHALYGVIHGILLPRVMDYNEPDTRNTQQQIRQVILSRYGKAGNVASEAGLGRVLLELLTKLRVPTRLRDVEFPRAEFPAVVTGAKQSFFYRENPRPVRDDQEVLDVLDHAW